MEGQDHHHKLTPLIIPRPEHPISRKMMSEEALKVLYRLHRHGFLAYLVGGSVRDLLLGKVPKDFDVATNAHPHEISALFRTSRIIQINGLFYNIADFSIIDYVGGIADLERQVIRTIGDPDERFQQDPVRMIRVIRHSARTGFSIEEQTYQAILRHREEIKKCSPSRLRDEFLRELKEGVPT